MQNNTFMLGFLNQIKTEAAKVDQCMRADLSALHGDIDALLSEVLDYGLFNGGKRIRPLLAVLGARLCGNQSEEQYRLGIAFEYLHAATLFHDDIIDQSEIRRGKSSVFKKFGTVAAILAGDFLHAHSMALVGQLAGEAGLRSFCRATKGMVDGEFMQLRNAQKYNLSELDYYDAVMGKTGLLIASACEVGAIYAGGDERYVEALRSYGENLGRAFQIIDDLLDYQGDPGKTGKKLGNDLVEGKMTLPVIIAVNRAGKEDKQRLFEILSNNELRCSSFDEVSLLIERYDGFTTAKIKAEEAVIIAEKQLQIFSSGGVSTEKKLLVELARFVITREK
ncbi:MAG: polyprenyl synthetase family protein [Desulfobulbaceae bacterium]|nr:polyprenyl synthetase family protein [Desulfobulbaceae bacterium]